MKADSKTIQAIHDAVITHNRRVSISGDLFTTFNLHIAQIEEKDRGEYMCQINTDPMTYQAGCARRETGRGSAQMKVERVQRQFSVETCTDV